MIDTIVCKLLSVNLKCLHLNTRGGEMGECTLDRTSDIQGFIHTFSWYCLILRLHFSVGFATLKSLWLMSHCILELLMAIIKMWCCSLHCWPLKNWTVMTVFFTTTCLAWIKYSVCALHFRATYVWRSEYGQHSTEPRCCTGPGRWADGVVKRRLCKCFCWRKKMGQVSAQINP